MAIGYAYPKLGIVAIHHLANQMQCFVAPADVRFGSVRESPNKSPSVMKYA